MKKWEFCSLYWAVDDKMVTTGYVTMYFSGKQTEFTNVGESLRLLGIDGWEPVSVLMNETGEGVSVKEYFFKRPLPN